MRWIFFPLALLASLPAAAQFYNDYELPPHNYFSAKMHDPMTKLMAKVKSGDLTIDEEAGLPLLERMLKELDLDANTQVLVFTKTSLQKRAVNPKNPRAIYFNDQVYLGWMPNGRIEIASFDPKLGPLFWFQRPLQEEKPPLFARTRSCLGCHAGAATNYIPGALGQSIYPDQNGRSIEDATDFWRSGHDIPFKERWGGWYVSGQYGKIRHLGNSIAKRVGRGAEIDSDQHANLKKLDQFFPTENFLAPGSDFVALLVFDHQVTMHYNLVEAGYRTRQSLYDSKLAPEELDPTKLKEGRSADEFAEAIDMVVNYLLFRDEAPLTSKVTGDPAFQKAFLADKRTTKSGRSLKDFDLESRIFKHRCSYMIYSPSFDALPPILKQEVYSRIHQILTTDDKVEGFEYLEADEKKHTLEILRETVEGFPKG